MRPLGCYTFLCLVSSIERALLLVKKVGGESAAKNVRTYKVIECVGYGSKQVSREPTEGKESLTNDVARVRPAPNRKPSLPRLYAH